MKNMPRSGCRWLPDKIMTLQNMLQKSSVPTCCFKAHLSMEYYKCGWQLSNTVTEYSLLPQTCSVFLLPTSKVVHTAYTCVMNNNFYIIYSGVCILLVLYMEWVVTTQKHFFTKSNYFTYQTILNQQTQSPPQNHNVRLTLQHYASQEIWENVLQVVQYSPCLSTTQTSDTFLDFRLSPWNKYWFSVLGFLHGVKTPKSRISILTPWYPSNATLKNNP